MCRLSLFRSSSIFVGTFIGSQADPERLAVAKLPFVGVAVGFFGSRHTSAFMGFRRQRARQRKVSFWLAAARPVETFRARVFRRGETLPCRP